MRTDAATPGLAASPHNASTVRTVAHGASPLQQTANLITSPSSANAAPTPSYAGRGPALPQQPNPSPGLSGSDALYNPGYASQPSPYSAPSYYGAGGARSYGGAYASPAPPLQPSLSSLATTPYATQQHVGMYAQPPLSSYSYAPSYSMSPAYNTMGYGSSYGFSDLAAAAYPQHALPLPGHLGSLQALHTSIGSVAALMQLLGMNADALQQIFYSATHLVERVGQATGEVLGFLPSLEQEQARLPPPTLDPYGRPVAQQLHPQDEKRLRNQRLLRWALGAVVVLAGMSAVRRIFRSSSSAAATAAVASTVAAAAAVPAAQSYALAPASSPSLAASSMPAAAALTALNPRKAAAASTSTSRFQLGLLLVSMLCGFGLGRSVADAARAAEAAEAAEMEAQRQRMRQGHVRASFAGSASASAASSPAAASGRGAAPDLETLEEEETPSREARYNAEGQR